MLHFKTTMLPQKLLKIVSLYRFNEFVPHDLNCLLRCHIYTFFILVFLLIWFNQMVHLVIRFKFIFFAITNVSLFVLSNQRLEKKTFNLTVGLFQTYLHLSLMIISSGDGTTAVVVRIQYQYGLQSLSHCDPHHRYMFAKWMLQSTMAVIAKATPATFRVTVRMS